jgi:methylenetetrahydrofolate reductase (NADPH)
MTLPSFSFEFFPPKAEAAMPGFWQAADELAELAPSFVSVTYGAGGSTRERTFEIVSGMAERYPFPPAAHLTCVGSTREEIDTLLKRYWQAGIRRIVALRGDPPEGSGAYVPTPGGYPYSSHLVEGIKAAAPFDVSVAGYPETHPDAPSAEADLIALKKKQDAGADRVITQFFFDTGDFLRYRDRAVSAGITIPILPGILPIGNFPKAKAFAGRCGASVPGSVAGIFDGLEPDSDAHKNAATNFCARQCDDLRREGVSHLHFYTLNRADLSTAVIKHLSA